MGVQDLLCPRFILDVLGQYVADVTGLRVTRMSSLLFLQVVGEKGCVAGVALMGSSYSMVIELIHIRYLYFLKGCLWLLRYNVV